MLRGDQVGCRIIFILVINGFAGLQIGKRNNPVIPGMYLQYFLFHAFYSPAPIAIFSFAIMLFNCSITSALNPGNRVRSVSQSSLFFRTQSTTVLIFSFVQAL